MEDPRELLVKIARILNKLKIQYMVTGGLAVFVFGRPRFTADIDIIIELAQPKVDALVDALRQIEGAGYIDRRAIASALLHKGEFNFISPNLGMKVDFWVLGRESYDQERLKRRVSRKILNCPVYFTASEDLILSKLRWYAKGGGERHLEDIKSVIQESNKIIDFRYLKTQAQKLGLDNLLQNLLNKNTV